MRKIALCAALLSLSNYALAEVNFCELIEPLGGGVGVRQVIWDTRTEAAKFTDRGGEEFVGSITNATPHDEGQKLNLRFHFDDADFLGFDSAEFIVFPVGGTHRVIGVGYIEKDDFEYLSGLLSNSDAHCVKL
jgi:hypothetical protein